MSFDICRPFGTPAATTQMQEQKLDFDHHYVTEFLLGGE